MFKKILPILSISLGAFTAANAQSAITLTENDIISVGNTAYLVSDTTPVASLSTEAMKSGANVSWDFSALHSHVSDQADFVTPSTTTYCSYYPSANLCAITKSTGYNAYFTNSSSGFVMTGLVGDLLDNGMTLKAFLSPGQTLMQFPATYQTTFNAPYTATTKEYYGQMETVVVGSIPITIFVDSVYAKNVYTISSEIDGWGTLKMPNGTTYDVLRQKNVETEVDSEFVYTQITGWMFVSVTSATTNRLRWWANGLGYALAECKYNPGKNKIKGDVQYVSATNPIVTSIAGIDFDQESASIFPNPATSQIKFSNLSANAAQLIVFDITGKLLNKTNIEANNGTLTLETSNYANGSYIYNIVDLKGERIQNGKFNVIH